MNDFLGTMTSKPQNKRGCRNTLSKLVSRQIHGGIPFSPRFPRSLTQCPFLRQYCVSLSKIQNGNAFERGHILLGFTKCGKYLMSYRLKIEENNYSDIPNHKYSLHWWRFNLMQPLEEVCRIALFGGEVFLDELHLLVCHTLNAGEIVVYGVSRASGDEQPIQSFVTITSSPPCTTCFSPNDTRSHHLGRTKSYAVHLKFDVLPPFPCFVPVLQLAIPGAVVINTVDSLVVVYIHKRHDGDSVEKLEHNGMISKLDRVPCSDQVSLSLDGNGNDVSQVNNDNKYYIKCDVENMTVEDQPRSPTLKNLSTFTTKTFCSLTEHDIESPSDGTPNVDIKVTGANGVEFQLIESEHYCNAGVVPQREMASCYSQVSRVQVKVVSMDIEKYIDQALNMSEQLSGKYWQLKNYTTQLIDISQEHCTVVAQVVCIIRVQPKISIVSRHGLSSISCFLTWDLSSGMVSTLDVSPLVDVMKKTDKAIFEEEKKKLLALRRKYSAPSGSCQIQTFSNHTIFSGMSLMYIKHPFQPIAVVL